MKRFIRKLKNLVHDLIRVFKTIKSGFKKKTTIWMIGDSTMCKYEKSYGPVTGWGMPFANFFDDTVIVKNKARGGYSTKTFLQQDFWWPVESNLKKGDYVIIQFGHNDENTIEPNIYTSPEEYRTNLLKFIKETIAKNAFPVLVTPIARRIFDDKGKIMDTHHIYTAVVKDLAIQQKLPLIDLDKLSRNLLQQLGNEKSKMLFNYLLPNENPYYLKGREDDEHLNELGARKIAELVLAEIKKQQLGIAGKIVTVFDQFIAPKNNQ